MFNLGLCFQILDLIKTTVLLNLGLQSFVIRAVKLLKGIAATCV